MWNKTSWTELGRLWQSKCGCVNLALQVWVLMGFDFGGIVTDALVVANCGDVVETCMEFMGRD